MALHSSSETQSQNIIWKDNIYNLLKSSLELLSCKHLLLWVNLSFKRPSLGQLVIYLGRVTHKIKMNCHGGMLRMNWGRLRKEAAP